MRNTWSRLASAIIGNLVIFPLFYFLADGAVWGMMVATGVGYIWTSVSIA